VAGILGGRTECRLFCQANHRHCGIGGTTLSLYEVFKRVLQQRGEDDALQAVALMQQGTVVELSASLALSAARISLNEKIPMADSIMLATARAYAATLWSQDADFKDIPGIQYRPKQ
jgi:predicted nucleic acid-binding protein